ncbi:uncharacterized protein BDV14DRAFT_200758 [Aspergillus stella-maris]|uniref:uncharacterized protein n=1 Tax=Aspergillus stella-maris TaxID=1810926 RepID=UPI003CCE0D28
MIFLRAITTNPILAQAVHNLRLANFKSSYTDEEKGSLKYLLKHAGLPPTDWSEDAGQRIPHNELAIVYCTNIEALHFIYTRPLPSFPTAFSSFTLQLPRLERVTVRSMVDSLRHKYDQLAPLLAAARNLKHLAAPIVTGALNNPSNIPELAHQEELDFSEGTPTLPSVRCLVGRSKNLRKLKLWIRDRSDDAGDADDETEKWSLATG